MVPMYHRCKLVCSIMPFFQDVENKQGGHPKIPRFAFSVNILAKGKDAVWLSPRSMQDTPCTTRLLACCFTYTAAATETTGIHICFSSSQFYSDGLAFH